MSHRHHDRGQATVEFAIALPLVAILVLAVVQLVVVARDQLAVELAAREGARAAAVAGSTADAATLAAESATTLRPLTVSTSDDGRLVTVTVTASNPTNVPLVGMVIADVEVRGSATMLREPP